MSKFRSVMAKNPPHVIIHYRRDAVSCHDQHALQVHGAIPIAQLIGFIVRVQAELAFRNPEEADPDMLVIAYVDGKMCWFVDPAIPVDALVGALELVKAQLVDSQMTVMIQEAQKRANTGLVTADGKPILKGH